MDIRVSCNWSSFASVCRKSAVIRQFSALEDGRCRRNLKKRNVTTTVQLQNPVGFSDRTCNYPSSAPAHKVTVHDRHRGIVHEFLVPEDQYILHTAESQNISLPFACRHGRTQRYTVGFLVSNLDKSPDPCQNFFGCCTSCAVRVKSGQIRQPEALGISAELKSKGYALLCVGFPSSDVEVETQDEDEVYWLQFGRYFARGPVERDDYALELAMGDE